MLPDPSFDPKNNPWEDESNLIWRERTLTAITLIFHNRYAWQRFGLRIIHLYSKLFFWYPAAHQQDSPNWKRALVFQNLVINSPFEHEPMVEQLSEHTNEGLFFKDVLNAK